MNGYVAIALTIALGLDITLAPGVSDIFWAAVAMAIN